MRLRKRDASKEGRGAKAPLLFRKGDIVEYTKDQSLYIITDDVPQGVTHVQLGTHMSTILETRLLDEIDDYFELPIKTLRVVTHADV